MDDGFKKPEEIVAKEKDGQDLERAMTAQQASMEKDEKLVAASTAASERLPFSKARCIALVATVGAAPFLSVSCGTVDGVFVAHAANVDIYGSIHRDHPPNSW